jgi:protein O-GlcNAc transferase
LAVVSDSIISIEQCLRLHQSQDWTGALAAYQKFLASEPNNLQALANVGAVYRQLGDVDNARSSYEKALAIDANFVACWFNLANLYLAAKHYDEAERCYRQVITREPKNSSALYQLAVVQRDQQLWQSCKNTLLATLELEANHTAALVDLGNVWRHLGSSAKSKACFLQLIAVDESSWKGHFSLAKWYDQQGEEALFKQHIDLALKYSPDAHVIHSALAKSRFDMGNYVGAAAQFELALTRNPKDNSAVISLGACAMQLGAPVKAKHYFQQVSGVDDVSVLSELARVIWEYKYFEEAIAILKKIVTLRPDLPDVYLNLAKAEYESWHLSAANSALDKALELRPNYIDAEQLKASVLLRQGKVDECLPLFKQQVAVEGGQSRAVSSYLFTELYSGEVSVEDKFAHHKSAMDKWVDDLAIAHVFTNSKDPDRKIRIGLISADFRDQHPVGIFIQPLLRELDRKKFQLTGYYCSRTFDTSTEIICQQMDAWQDAAGWTDERLRERIIADEIDVLVDLSGHTAKHRLGVFAMRAAPIQVTWMGYPHSTGLRSMDYLIADRVVCPPENDALCSEQVLRLENHSVFCFSSTDNFPEADADKTKQRKHVVFGSFNNLTKVNKKTLALWCDVMLAVPDALLKLKTPSFADSNCMLDVMAYFIDSGIAKERLLFSGPSSLEDMMAEYSEVDIGLDTLPYNGGTTSFQALWMGVPVLTLAGENFCGRMGASAMTFLGMDEWVATSSDELIKKAVVFAANQQSLVQIKLGLRDKMQNSALCNEKGFADEWGGLIYKAWIDYCLE